MGGASAEVPDRYLEADPSRLLPAGGPVWLMHGTADDRVPYLMSLDYALWARSAGVRPAEATCVILPGAGHFEVIDPLSREWPQVVEAFSRVGALGWRRRLRSRRPVAGLASRGSAG
jgi:pimeloyl-ACP methyl ester carboxylesterase